MKLTPEQVAQGWKLHDGSSKCPIKDIRTKVDVLNSLWVLDPHRDTDNVPQEWYWPGIRAYRIIEARGADAETTRPTPFPASYDELVFDDAGWSQTIIVDGKRPEWLRDDDRCVSGIHWNAFVGNEWGSELAIRVRRREPKRETVRCWVKVTYEGNGPYETGNATIDLIDGKPDLSTIRITEPTP